MFTFLYLEENASEIFVYESRCKSWSSARDFQRNVVDSVKLEGADCANDKRVKLKIEKTGGVALR